MERTPMDLPPSHAQATRAGTFRALRHRNFRLWFFGQGFSLIGTWMQTMAQQVLIYRLTGSAAALGMVNFVSVLPLAPLALLGGSLSDRYNKRTIILICQTTLLIQALIFALLTWLGTIQVWHIYVLAFFQGASNAIDVSARQSFVLEMIDDKEDATNAIGLNSSIFNAARALGPALAGALVAIAGEAVAFFINGLTFLTVIAALLMMRNLNTTPRRMVAKGGVGGHMAEGVRFVLRNQVLMLLMSLVAVSAFLSMPYSTLMPVFASKVLAISASPTVVALCHGNNPLLNCRQPEALVLGILMAFVGIGAVTGALLVASLPKEALRGRMLTIGNLAFPALLIVFSLSRAFYLSLGALVLVGISFVWQNSLANTLLQLNSPDHVRGRVMSIFSLTFQGAMRLGGMSAGLMADGIGAPLTVGIGAATSLAYGLFVAIRFPKVRQLT